MTTDSLSRSELRLTVPAEARSVPQVRSSLAAFCRGGGWRGRAVNEVGLAATELLNNAIEHGDGAGRGLKVILVLEPDRLVLRIVGGTAEKADELRRALGNSDGLPDDDDERGRGLFLVCACMDRVQVRTVGGMTLVRLVKMRRRPR